MKITTFYFLNKFSQQYVHIQEITLINAYMIYFVHKSKHNLTIELMNYYKN